MATTIECNIQPGGAIPADHALLYLLWLQLAQLHENGSPMTEWLLDRREPPADRFLARSTFVDGRVWREWVMFDGTTNSEQQFDIYPAVWRSQVIVYMRPVRNAMFQILSAFPTINTIRYTFT